MQGRFLPREALGHLHILPSKFSECGEGRLPTPIGRGLFALASRRRAYAKRVRVWSETLRHSAGASSQRPAPHPSGLSVSAAIAACDAKAESPLPLGRGGVRCTVFAHVTGRRCIDALDFREGGSDLWSNPPGFTPSPKTALTRL